MIFITKISLLLTHSTHLSQHLCTYITLFVSYAVFIYYFNCISFAIRLSGRKVAINSFAADFLAPSAGKNIYVREIKLQPLTFVNTAITVANGTEGVMSTIVANGSERVNRNSRKKFVAC